MKFNSEILNLTYRVGPKRLANYLARIVPREPAGVVISFDLPDTREVEHQINVWVGLVLKRQRYQREGTLANWTVRFFRRESAERFLQRFHLLDHKQLSDYEVR